MAGTEVLDVVDVLRTTCTNLDNIKAAIISKGVAVDGQTGVSQYADLINSITVGDPVIINQMQEEIDTLTGEVESLNTEVTDLNGQVESLNTEVTNLNGQVTSLNTQVETDNTDFTNIYNAIITKGGTCTESDHSSYDEGVLSITTSSGGGNTSELEQQIANLNSQIEIDNEQFLDIYNAIICQGGTCDENDRYTYDDGILSIDTTGGTGDTSALEQQIADLNEQVSNLDTQVNNLTAQVNEDNSCFSDIYSAIVDRGGTCTESDHCTYVDGIYSIPVDGGSAIGAPDYIITQPTSLQYAFALNYGGNILKPTQSIINTLDTSLCTNMEYTFNGNIGIETIDISSWDFSKCTSETQMFQNNRGVKKIVFPNNVVLKGCSGMFSGCSALERIEGSLNLGQCSNISSMFSNCKKLVHLVISDFSYSSNQTLRLENCISLDVQTLIDNLPQYTGSNTKTIRIASALMTDALASAASAKGYTLTT